MQMQLKTPIYQAIASDLRVQIRDKFRPGDLLPSEAKLSTQYKVNNHTIRRSLEVLSSDNIIRRHKGRGSVVLDRNAVGEFAIVLCPNLLNTEVTPYYNLLSGMLIKLLHESNPRWIIKLHVGRNTETGIEFPATLDLLVPDVLRNLRGVFSFVPLYEVRRELDVAGVPVVGLHDFEIPPRVFFDKEYLYTLGLAHLKEAGCKTVGMIWSVNPNPRARANNTLLLFQHVAKANGFEVRPEWTTPFSSGDFTEQEGYEAMTQLWKNQSHPDGILVQDDIPCRGVLRAAAQLGIEVPRDLRLVTYAGRGIALHYHRPVSRVEYDLAEQARLAVEMMLTLVEGRIPPSTRIDLPGVLIKGETT